MTALTSKTLRTLAPAAAVPRYPLDMLCTGIVHFGVGGFHRSHEAMYVDRLLAAGNADWAICGVGVRAADARMRVVLAAQDYLYTLITRDTDGDTHAQVVGSIVDFLYAPGDPQTVVDRLADPSTRIVSLTITEGGYGVDDASCQFAPHDPDILHDLQAGAVPRSALGFITAAPAIRRDRGIAPFTVMSCDNIEHNGAVARTALTAFAEHKDPELSAWIAQRVAFPNSMVDRITPTTAQETIDLLAHNFGVDDQWPVLAESFEQWVIEDQFSDGRPPFDSVGAQFVDDVEPYELMKLRLLNASHQVMSYLGLLAGCTYVNEIFENPELADFVMSYMRDEATPTLPPVPGIDLAEYQQQLRRRFASTTIRDTLARQIVDASDRIPKFVLPVIRDQLRHHRSISHTSLTLAAWCTVIENNDESIPLVDKRIEQLRQLAHQDRHRPGAFLHPTTVGDLANDGELQSAYRAAKQAPQHHGAVGAALMASTTGSTV